MICPDCAKVADLTDTTGVLWWDPVEVSLMTEMQQEVMAGHSRCKGCTCQHRGFGDEPPDPPSGR